MRVRTTRCLPLLALIMAMGCASTTTTDRQEYEGPTLPRPGRIIVYDFGASPEDLPAWYRADAAFAIPETPPKPEDLEKGRELGEAVAKELVAKIAEMGLTAVRADGQPAPSQNDLVLIGYFSSVDDGSALKRIVIGFGSGGADLKTHVDGYRMTGGSLQKLGSGNINAGDSKGPGMVVPAIVTVATANPIGLAVGGAVKAAGELSGRTTIEGSGKRTAGEIAEQLKPKFEAQGWIQ